MKRRRATTLSFVLASATDVVLTVKQLSPACRIVGRFIVHGRAGLNRIRFAGRVGRQELAAGTYRITARTRDGRSVQRVVLVVVEAAAPTRTELVALRGANACSASGRFASAAANATSVSNTGGLSDSGGGLSTSGDKAASGPARSSTPDSSGILGAATVEKVARAVQPALIALLAAAIVLLTLASAPRLAVVDPRFNDALARHRPEIAGVGAAALAAAVIAFLLG